MKKPARTWVRLMVFVSILISPFFSNAQKYFTGKIINQTDQSPIPGASVAIKGKPNGVSSGADGTFSVNAKEGDVLIISGINLKAQEFIVGNSLSVTIPVEQNSNSLNEVVVTALGVKKERKKLGYAVQEVKGEELIKAREPNAINGLVGKVAGLTVGASAELLGNPNVLLRGSNINLYVVDGVPINSDTWNISPDDIETYTVLKGASASALYGSRGLNGAIMITTKKGSKTDEPAINYSGNMT